LMPELKISRYYESQAGLQLNDVGTRKDIIVQAANFTS
jgi:hypothetical protein